jgi:hypothetical protein
VPERVNKDEQILVIMKILYYHAGTGVVERSQKVIFPNVDPYLPVYALFMSELRCVITLSTMFSRLTAVFLGKGGGKGRTI